MINAMEKLYEELVPSKGKADMIAGEIVRAFARIEYRNFNDGDHIGVGYGNETCNAAARYLRAVCDDAIIEMTINGMWGTVRDDTYDALLHLLECSICEYINYRHPELKEAKNETDMWDYFDKEEDRDYDDDEDEW